MTHRTAKTIIAIADGSDIDLRWITDRSVEITEEMVQRVIARGWCHYAGRRPKTPTKTSTDMDLASYLPALLERGAVVSIEGYERLTPQVTDSDDRRIGDIRFGRVVKLVSHRELLSFSLCIEDASVVGSDGFTESVGQARTFTLLAPNGEWHAAPTKLSWRERSDEADFNAQHQLQLADIATFVHRNRAESVMASAYLANKALLIRLDDMIEHFRSVHQTGQVSQPAVVRHQNVASEIVPSFTMQVEGIELTGEYQTHICHKVYLDSLIRWRQQVQWLTRVNEYAFYRHGMDGGYTAPWVRGPQWQSTGEGQARLQLHPDLAISYHLRQVSRATFAKHVPLAATGTNG